MSLRTLSLLLLAAVVVAACNTRQEDGAESQSDDAAHLTVFASNYPVFYFAERLAPDSVQVIFPIPDDVDPAYWRPDPYDISAVQSAGLILLNGATFEKWRDYVSLPEERVVETAAVFRSEWLQEEAAVVHSHGPTGEHEHGDVDFNTWLNPLNAIKQAEAVARALARRLPNESRAIQGRLATLHEELQDLDEEFAAIAEIIGDQPVVASHPVYDYFAARYEINLVSVHWEPDVAPTSEEWSQLDELLANHPAKVMLWEGEPLEEIAAELTRRGIAVVLFETAVNKPDAGDYMRTMQSNADRLKNAF